MLKSYRIYLVSCAFTWIHLGYKCTCLYILENKVQYLSIYQVYQIYLMFICNSFIINQIPSAHSTGKKNIFKTRMPKIKKQLENVLEHSNSASDNKSKLRYGFPYRKKSNFCCFQNSFQLFTSQPGKICLKTILIFKCV